MTKTITLINTAADTFGVWVNKTNEIANAFTQEAVTANSDANGSITAGNAQFTGIFSIATLGVVTALRGGNVQTAAALPISSNVAISGIKLTVGNSTVNSTANAIAFSISNSTVAYSYILPTATQKAANNFWLNANGTFADVDAGLSVTTTGTSAQLIDSWNISSNYSMEYTITIDDLAANNRSVVKAILLQDEGSAYVTEFAIINSNTDYGVLTANANSTVAKIYITPTSASTTVRLRKQPNKK